MTTHPSRSDSGTAPGSAARRLYFYTGVVLVCASTLVLQLVQTRILSVTTWYHLAFFVISMAMFGLTAGAVAVYIGKDHFTREKLSLRLAQSTMAFAVGIPISLLVQLSLAPAISATLMTAIVFAVLAICLAVPFFFAGIVVSLCLTRSPYPVGHVYGADLLGAGMGCLLALLLMNLTDAPSAVLFVSVLAAAAAICFAKAELGDASETGGRGWRLLERRGAILVALLLLAVVNSLTDHGIQPIFIKGRVETHSKSLEFVEWNSFSRIAAYASQSDSPALWGPSPRLPSELRVDQRKLDIDGLAATTMYRFDNNGGNYNFLKYDVTNLAYFLPDRHSAAVIGVGGGRDVLSAWSFGADRVVGVEINPIFIRLHTEVPDFANYSGLSRLDNVNLVVDEARSWFARTDQSFDIIQMSLIDTWAATGAGAFTLSENGLYTTEAWEIFLKRLTDDGVFTVSRWFGRGEVNETGRMVSLGIAAMMDLGVVDPRQHVFVAASGNIATLVLSKSPFSAEDIRALQGAADQYAYQTLIAPGSPAASELLERLVSAHTREELHAAVADVPLDLTPPSDDRPFFFNQLRLDRPTAMLEVIRKQSAGTVFGNLLATASLLTILLVSVLLVVATIVIPLRFSIRNVDRRLLVSGTAYFLLIGLGFMMVEIALMQRTSVFLGHPVYALSVVLFSIIAATGIGSLISERFPLDTPAKFAAWAVALSAYLASLTLWAPDAFLAAEGGKLLTRMCVAAGIILPAGLLMGFGFPTGIRLVSAVDDRPTPWFWGINGAAGVLAGGLALTLGMMFGIGTTLLIACACYLALIPPAIGVGFPSRAGAQRA